MNIQAKKVLILYFKNMTVGDYRVVLDYADMPLSNFVIEYLRKNEKFRETVFDCSYEACESFEQRQRKKICPLKDDKNVYKNIFLLL